MSEEEKGFVIKDRRHFTEEGEPKTERGDRKDEAAGRGAAQAQDAGTAERGKENKEKTGWKAERTAPLPEITFSTFVFSLSTSAMMHLGEIPDPNTNKPNVNLALAKQTIDILGMLKEKTKGNLLEDEKNLLDNLLYDLRLKYVKKAQK